MFRDFGKCRARIKTPAPPGRGRREGVLESVLLEPLGLLLAIVTSIVIVCASSTSASEFGAAPPEAISPFFRLPPQYRDDYGGYRSPLTGADGSIVDTAEKWQQRRESLRKEWEPLLGPWPPLVASPQVIVDFTEVRDQLVWSKVRIAAGVGGECVSGYLLKPRGEGPFPAVLVVYYEPESGAGLGVELRDFGLQLARRGFVTLSIGPPGVDFRPAGAAKHSKQPYFGPIGKPVRTQPLSALAYAAANCHTFLSREKTVDPQRIGIAGHSFGGKWAMFASCLYDKFACAVWSDPGIVFDERDRKDNVGGSVNYWEKWYLGHELGEVPTAENSYQFRGRPRAPSDRTGTYRRLFAEGRDLVELHALMAPRPFLVSGGSADREERWKALNHTIAVNRVLGQQHGVAMTNRLLHPPTTESNEQIYRFFEWAIGD
jgi:dienelactone hydrolase